MLLVHYDPKQPNGMSMCTGSLLAPKLVLTARHCVAKTAESAACDEQGNPIGSGGVSGDNDPSTLYVFTGTKLPFGQSHVTPAATGAQIVDDGSTNLCNHDIALLVLDKEIIDMPIIPVRVDSDVQEGELVTSVGWGVTDKESTPSVRQQRAEVAIKVVGPAKSSGFPVPPNEFEVGESICSGDSGGPAIADTGAVVGIVSRGGNGQQPDQNNPSATCVGTSASNLYTKLSPFKDLLLQAYDAAGAEPWFEGGEDPRKAKPGEACTDASDCRSNLCLADRDQKNALTCAQDCSSAECSSGQVCVAEGDAKVCRLPASVTTTTTTSSCSASPRSVSTTGILAVFGVFGAFASARRRRIA